MIFKMLKIIPILSSACRTYTEDAKNKKNQPMKSNKVHSQHFPSTSIRDETFECNPCHSKRKKPLQKKFHWNVSVAIN